MSQQNQPGRSLDAYDFDDDDLMCTCDFTSEDECPAHYPIDDDLLEDGDDDL